MQKTATRRVFGFTLIELMVVVSIIAVLSAIVIASIGSARSKTRDSARKADLKELQLAIETHKQLVGNYPITTSDMYTYPPVETPVHGGLACAGVSGIDISAGWIPGIVSSGILQSLPSDPLGKNHGGDASSNPEACYLYASDGTNYVLSAWGTVENPIDTTDEFYSENGFIEYWNSEQRYTCDPGNLQTYLERSYTITTLGLNCP